MLALKQRKTMQDGFCLQGHVLIAVVIWDVMRWTKIPLNPLLSFSLIVSHLSRPL